MSEKKTVKWTKQQTQAIKEHRRSVFVSASAGTGKTAVLSGSCVDVITNPSACPDVWSILVVTFTDMAAEEMRSRIARRLTSVMESSTDSALRQHLRRQLILLGAADVSTIHSFCKRLITEHFFKLDLDPTFGIIDADEAKLLKTETLEKTIDWAWKEVNLSRAMRDLLDRRDLRTNDGFLSTIIEISDFLDGVVSRSDWLERAQILTQSTDPFATDLAQGQKQIVAEQLQKALNRIRHAQKLYLNASVGKEIKKFEDLYIKPIARLLEVFEKDGWSAFSRAIHNYTKPRVETPKETDKELAGLIKDTVKEAVDSIENICEMAVLNPDYLARLAGAVSTQTMVLLKLVERFDQLYAQAKKSINCLDFADLEHYALRLLASDEKRCQEPFSLEPSETALTLREKYKYIFVDEFQDINGVQQAIIDMLCSPANLFVVGDPKQSIYQWRGARPEIFRTQLQRASAESKSADIGLRVDLNVNFRSDKPILDFVNKVFGRIMTASFAGVDYDESAYLKPAPENINSATTAPAVELHILEKMQTGAEEQVQDDDQASQLYNSRQLQAALIARRIKQMVGARLGEEQSRSRAESGTQALQILDRQTGQPRPLEYRDIVILMRKLSGKNDFVEALRLSGIPVTCEGVAGYFEATEITDMLSLLKVLDNPRRDIELAAVLRSPFFNFTDTELAKIRLHACPACPRKSLSGEQSRGSKKNNPEPGFYDCVLSLCKSDDFPDLADKLNKTLATLDEWRTAARRGRPFGLANGGLAELIWHIYRRTGYLSFVCALPDGPARRANLLKLHDRAIQFENFASSAGVPSLTRFVDFVEKLIASGSDWSSRQPEPAAGNSVRVLSVHKSKGLEFPVVFLADLSSPFGKNDSNRDCLVDEQSTLGLRLIDAGSNSRLDSIGYQLIEEHARHKSLAEEMRILYVAMTRAINRLVLVGCKDKKTCQSILTAASLFDEQSIPDWFLETRQSHLDWILSALSNQPLLHQTFQTDLKSPPADDNLFTVQFYDQSMLTKLSALIRNSKLKTKHSKPTLSVVLSETDISSVESKDTPFLKQSLNWHYPFADAPLLPAKRTVTQWTHRNDEFAKIDCSRAFERKPKAILSAGQISDIDGRVIGSAVHLILSQIDLAKPVTIEATKSLIVQLVANSAITESVAPLVDAESIVKFFKTELGQMTLDKNNLVLREWPFTFAIPASQWVGLEQETQNFTRLKCGGLKLKTQDSIIVQGIIDLLIKTPDGLVVIDFKTDDVPHDQLPHRAELYRRQLDLYAQAATAILGQKVLAKYLYFLHPGREIEV
jgi:ATP-dependent helicase/nuclease subunit A